MQIYSTVKVEEEEPGPEQNKSEWKEDKNESELKQEPGQARIKSRKEASIEKGLILEPEHE